MPAKIPNQEPPASGEPREKLRPREHATSWRSTTDSDMGLPPFMGEDDYSIGVGSIPGLGPGETSLAPTKGSRADSASGGLPLHGLVSSVGTTPLSVDLKGMHLTLYT